MTPDEIKTQLSNARASCRAEWARHDAAQYHPTDPGWMPSIDRVQAAEANLGRALRLHRHATRRPAADARPDTDGV